MRKGRILGMTAATLALLFVTGLSAAAGDLDTTFGSGGKVLTDFAGGSVDVVYGVAVQPDRKVVVAGDIWDGVDSSFAVARYTEKGVLDPTFDGDGKVRTDFTSSSAEGVSSIAVQSDGKIVVAGGVSIPGSPTRSDFALVRYDSDGSLDASFDGDGKVVTDIAGGTDFAYSIAMQPDGKILVAGRSRPMGSGPPYDFAVARYNPNGSLDGSFDEDGRVVTDVSAGASDYPSRIVVGSDGKIVVGGQIASGPPVSFSAGLVRYTPNGALDGSFDGDGKVVVTTPIDSIFDLALQPDGKILAAGSGFGVTRFNSNGSVDTTFDGHGHALYNSTGAYGMTLQRDGRTVIAGPLGDSVTDFALARFDRNGKVDTAFGRGGTVRTDFGGSDVPRGVALAPDGKIIVAGSSASAGSADFAVARYLAAPPPCKVPNVQGKTLPAAKAGIKKARCTVGKITRRASRNVRKGRVISQRPRAGATVPNATKVNLVVSKGGKR